MKEQGGEGLTEVPLDVIREHAHEDVGAHMVLGAVVNRPHKQVHSLETTKGPLDNGEAFVFAHGVFSRKLRLGLAGADDVDAIEPSLTGDGGFRSSPCEATVLDGELIVLAHLVAPENPTGLETDFGLVQWFLRSSAHFSIEPVEALLRR